MTQTMRERLEFATRLAARSAMEDRDVREILDAVLAALMSPTEAMVAAALDRHQGLGESLPTSVFTAMIDAVREGR